MPGTITERTLTDQPAPGVLNRPTADGSATYPSPSQAPQTWFSRAATGLAATRVLLGCIALALPGAAGRAWIGQGASGRDRAVLLRALGGRDVALGVGALLALRSGGDTRRWLLMGAASDLIDTAASTVGFSALPRWRRWLVLTASGGASCAGVVLASNLPASS